MAQPREPDQLAVCGCDCSEQGASDCNEAGGVLSAVLLPPDIPGEVHYDAADQRALELARRLRFAPSLHLTVGLLIFNWRTVPPPATHSSAAAP